MNMRREMMKKLDETTALLTQLVRADVPDMEVNVRYGMTGHKRLFKMQITKQMTLDAYIDNNEQDGIMSFPVLDITIDKRIFHRSTVPQYSTQGLAIELHRSARKLSGYNMR